MEDMGGHSQVALSGRSWPASGQGPAQAPPFALLGLSKARVHGGLVRPSVGFCLVVTLADRI